jgi:NTE family protein
LFIVTKETLMNRMPEFPPNHRYDETALVLQGGGALGAYQAGTYEALAEAGVLPDWFAGISIGSINAAIMAGNPPAKRVEALRSFWNRITEDYPSVAFWPGDTLSRRIGGTLSGLRALGAGIPVFFKPRFPSAWLQMPGAAGALSHYDTSPLRDTLLKHIDFDLLNSGVVRLSLGAVNVRTGNFTYFDTTQLRIGPEHVMASGALPPGFPPIRIDGEYYWDGGLVSNTPLSHVLGNAMTGSTLVFQVDLFSARGPFPETISDVEERRKDIVYSSRTRLNTDILREKHALQQAIAELAQLLPDDVRSHPRIAELTGLAREHTFSVVHLIYRRAAYDGPSKDYEFSRRSMLEHWAAGHSDGIRSLRTTEWRIPPQSAGGIDVYDTNRSGVN